MNDRMMKTATPGAKAAYVLRGIVCACLLFHLYCALLITGILPGYAGSFHEFTVPHLSVIVVSIIGVVLSAVVHEPEVHWGSIIALALLIPTFYFALHEWPGGDDGPGIAWLVTIGGLSVVNTLVGILLSVIAHRIEAKNQARMESEARP